MWPHCCKLDVSVETNKLRSSLCEARQRSTRTLHRAYVAKWQTLEVHAQLSAHLGEVSCNESHAYSEVCLVEIVGHIPAQLAILASFLHHCMEQRQYPDQWPECLRSQVELQAALCF